MTTRPDAPWLIRERLLMLVLLGASVVVGWLCWRLVKPFVPAITWALVLTVLAHPLHERLLAMFKKWPSISAALAAIAVTLAIALPATLLVRQIGSEAVAQHRDRTLALRHRSLEARDRTVSTTRKSEQMDQARGRS